MTMSLKKLQKRLDTRIQGYKVLVQKSSTGGKEYTKPGKMKK